MTLPVSDIRQLFWRLQLGSWLLLMPFLTGVVLIAYDLRTALLIGVVRQAIGFLITLGLWQIYRRWSTHQFSFTRNSWRIALWCIAATAIDALVAEIFSRFLLTTPPSPIVQYGSLAIRSPLFIAWSALYFLIRQEITSRAAELRMLRAEAANREAELQQLRAQMNPHFIFNALNTIIGQAEENPAAVIETTHAVADYLRYSLSQNSHQAPLGDELDAMANYLQVERTNYGEDRLNWHIEATLEARLALAPTALVQPLIENAIKYGMRSARTTLHLRIDARVENEQLVVSVENSGEWVQRDPAAPSRTSHGIGHANLQRRLQLLFGPAAHFEVTTPPGLVRITIRVPRTEAVETTAVSR